jgi:hypothetical protein
MAIAGRSAALKRLDIKGMVYSSGGRRILLYNRYCEDLK